MKKPKRNFRKYISKRKSELFLHKAISSYSSAIRNAALVFRESLKSRAIKLILILFISTCAISCGLRAADNTTQSISWINEHKKPIRCIANTVNMNNERSYTLIDSAGVIYSTGYTNLALPDTLKK